MKVYKRWPEEIKTKAKLLRKKGYSYGQLTKEFNVAKSTLHQWIRGLKRPKKFTEQDRIRWIKVVQPMGAEMNRRLRIERVDKIKRKVKEEISKFKPSLEVKKSILSMLYWAEGSKTEKEVNFANTDPKLSLLFITLLRECFEIDEKRLRLRIFIHYYHNKNKIMEFWSNLLDVPIEQFHKAYLKKRSKTKRFRQNFAGICFIRYGDVAIKDEILQFAFAIADKIVKKRSLS